MKKPAQKKVTKKKITPRAVDPTLDAKQAIKRVDRDTSVPAAKTIERLEDLRDAILDMLEAHREAAEVAGGPDDD